MNGGKSAEKFKLGLNNFANPYRLFTETLLQIESTDDWSKKKNESRKNSSPPPPISMQGLNLFEIYLNSNKPNVFILIEVAYQTQNFKFLMSNFSWQVMIVQNLPENHSPILQHASCNLRAFQTTISDFT